MFMHLVLQRAIKENAKMRETQEKIRRAKEAKEKAEREKKEKKARQKALLDMTTGLFVFISCSCEGGRGSVLLDMTTGLCVFISCSYERCVCVYSST